MSNKSNLKMVKKNIKTYRKTSKSKNMRMKHSKNMSCIQNKKIGKWN